MRTARALPLVVAALLGAGSAAAAVRAVLLEPRHPGPPPGGAFGAADAERVGALLARLVQGLLQEQGEAGDFDPFRDDHGREPVRRTVSHALATAALARAAGRGAGEQVPHLQDGLDRALAVLRARQEPGGGFGAMPMVSRNPVPGVQALSAAVLALLWADRPEDEEVLDRALAALGRATTYGVLNGWTRALAAIAVDGASAQGGPDPAVHVKVEESRERAGCGDFAVAEAIAQRVHGRVEGRPARVLEQCMADPPEWVGDRTDCQSWWMQAWLAARMPGGARWFRSTLAAVEEAEASPPPGRVAGSIYADGIAQTASAILVLCEGLDRVPPSPRPPVPQVEGSGEGAPGDPDEDPDEDPDAPADRGPAEGPREPPR